MRVNHMRLQGKVRLLYLASAIVAMLMVFASGREALAQGVDFQKGWVKSGDPCFPMKQEKRWLKKTYKVSADHLSCIPLQITVTWKLTESYRHHGKYGVDRAQLELEEKFDGFLRLQRAQKKPRQVVRFQIHGPAPCCPGKISSELLAAQATVLGCTRFGEECTRFTTDGTAIPFTVDPQRNKCNFIWDAVGADTKGEGGSAVVRLAPGVVKRPYLSRSGVLNTLKGQTFTFRVKGPDSFTWAEIKQGLESGEVTKVFPLNDKTVYPGVNETHALTGTVTVKLEFGEQEDEHWQVTVTASERTMGGPPIKVRPPNKKYIRMPVRVKFDWALRGKFIIKRSKQTWSYKSGAIASAAMTSKVLLPRWDLYQCFTPKCKNKPPDPVSGLAGASLHGKRVSGGLRLAWPNYRAEACVMCMPMRTYMKKIIYRHRFGSGEMMFALSKLVMPLKDGWSKKIKVGKFMTYTITLRKLK